MLSIRSLARSVPRAATRLTTVWTPVVARASIITMQRASRAAFSTTINMRAPADGETDDELSAKLESEIQIEEDIKSNEQQPASIKDFLDNSPFELIDTPGQEVVKLVRTFGEEKYASFIIRF